MRKRFFCALLVLTALGIQGQENQAAWDSLYREDQIYLGFTYNLITGKPSEVTTSQFSGGFHLGFIRDFPINKRRNVALGIGLGWSIDTYGQNLFIGEMEGSERTLFQILNRDNIDFNRNRFTTQSIDLPIQFRWRTSTVDTYKFWRIYAGLRPSYSYYFNSVFEQEGNIVKQNDVPEFERIRWGATFTFGYNTFNFYFYYSLNSFFKDDVLVEQGPVDLRALQVGLVFYLL